MTDFRHKPCGAEADQCCYSGDKAVYQERDALKARVIELEEAMHYVLGAWDYDGVSPEHGAIRLEAETRLNRTPAQSLEAHDREVSARAFDRVSDDAEKARSSIIEALIASGDGHRVSRLPELSVSVAELRNRAEQIRAGGEG